MLYIIPQKEQFKETLVLFDHNTILVAFSGLLLEKASFVQPFQTTHCCEVAFNKCLWYLMTTRNNNCTIQICDQHAFLWTVSWSWRDGMKRYANVYFLSDTCWQPCYRPCLKMAMSNIIHTCICSMSIWSDTKNVTDPEIYLPYESRHLWQKWNTQKYVKCNEQSSTQCKHTFQLYKIKFIVRL